MKLERRIDELKSESAAAERDGDSERLNQLVMEQLELTKQRSALLPQSEVATIQ